MMEMEEPIVLDLEIHEPKLRAIDIDVKKPAQMDMYHQFIAIGKERRVPDEGLLFPIMKWASNCNSGIKPMIEVNKYFFTVPKDILVRNIVLNFPRQPFISYPKKKPSKDKDVKKFEEQIEVVAPYICKYFGWSEREFAYQKEFMTFDEELFMQINSQYDLEDKEKRKLGITTRKKKIKFQPVSKNLMSF
jgi:hypothetical protein